MKARAREESGKGKETNEEGVKERAREGRGKRKHKKIIRNR